MTEHDGPRNTIDHVAWEVERLGPARNAIVLTCIADGRHGLMTATAAQLSALMELRTWHADGPVRACTRCWTAFTAKGMPLS